MKPKCTKTGSIKRGEYLSEHETAIHVSRSRKKQNGRYVFLHDEKNTVVFVPDNSKVDNVARVRRWLNKYVTS